ncbi:MAG: hypothetical protein IPK19_18325 [Chloroflexi bacterium]|nr:hypothetical protein [Chloroflexota bacterium]
MNKRACFLILTLLACFTFDLRAFPLSIARLSADDASILSGIVTERNVVTTPELPQTHPG